MVNPQIYTNIALTFSLVIVAFFFWLMWKKKWRPKNWQIFLIACIPLIITVGVGVIVSLIARPQLTAITDNIPAYREVDTTPIGEEYARNKILIIGPAGDLVHEAYYKLPKERRATTPNEVGTVAVVNCSGSVRAYQTLGGRRVATYYNSSSCDIKLIDWTLPAVLNTHRIHELGASPESLFDDVVAYLVGLPVK